MTGAGYTVDQANQFLQTNFAPWVLDLKPVVTVVNDGSIQLEIPANPALYRVGRIVCGQALMALADTAMVLGLVSALEESRLVTTVDMNTTFMRPVADDVVIAKTEVSRLGRTMAFMRVVMNARQTGKPVSHATGTYAVLPGS